MQNLRTQLTKYQNFVSASRHLKEKESKGAFMQNEQQNNVPPSSYSRHTGGYGANKRYKRTSEELDMDVSKVDELVASGRFNQIEALDKVGLQSSVYHYRKRQLNEPVAISSKPRKFAPRPNRKKSEREVYEAQKAKIITKLEQPKQAAPKQALELDKLKRELAELREKYAKIQEYVIDKVVLG